MSIKILSPLVAGSIAAGEVVERPMSVVKELIENSLDAGASIIDVTVQGVHLENIRVHDDGRGISPEDLALALERHATSKLPHEDITKICTLGYRGEALPSIGAVADVNITSRQVGMDCAFLVSSRGGQIHRPKPAAGREGTLVEVSGLFLRHPARLKFLKSSKTEAASIREVVAAASLAYPHVEFRVSINGTRSIFPSRPSLIDRAYDVLGGAVANDALALCVDADGIHVSGFACIPSASRSDASGIRCSVNGRPVTDKIVRSAVKAAYSSLIGPGRHPQAYIDLTVPLDFVDINVHPRKAEVRFMKPKIVSDCIIRAITNALAGSGLKSPSALPDLALKLSQSSEISADDTMRRPLGKFLHQVSDSWLICETADGIVIIDQHAAHERVILERLKQQIDDITAPVFRYPTPKQIDVTLLEAAAIYDNLSTFKRCGFEVLVNENTVSLLSVPAILIDCKPEDLLGVILRCAIESVEDELLNEVMWEKLATAACKAAIKAGDRITPERADLFLREIEATPNASYCNHGRPTVAYLTNSNIAKLFSRG